MNKSDLRKQIRAAYQGREERNRQSRLICSCILDSQVYRQANVIGGYIPLETEADIIPVMQDALSRGKTLVLPRCGIPPHMQFYKVSSLDDTVPGAYGIPEPCSEAILINPICIDLLLVPLEGIDHSGIRLGKGAGYYDAFLQKNERMTLGCALSWQWQAFIPSERWDIPLRGCADMNGIHYFYNTTKKEGTDYGKEKGENSACLQAISEG